MGIQRLLVRDVCHMKEQLDEMNFSWGPGCCFWYSYRHTIGRRLNKHYSLVKNMTLRFSPSAAVNPPNHTSVHFCLHVGFNPKTFPFGYSPSLFMSLSSFACTSVLFLQSICEIIHLEYFLSWHFPEMSCSQSESERMFFITKDMKLPVQIGHWSAESLQSSPKT